MPSPVGHTLGAFAAMVSIQPDLLSNRHKKIIALAIAFVFGSLADADFIVAHFATAPYLRHHYFSHSIPFAIALTIACWLFFQLFRVPRPAGKALLLGLAYSSHLFLDYLAEDGSKPYGIPVFWPVFNQHFISPVQIFFSIRRGEFSDIFSLHNLAGILVEAAILGPVLLLVIVAARRRLLEMGRFPSPSL